MNWFKKTIAAVLALLTIFGTTITTPIIAEDTAGTGTQTTETAVSSVIQGSYEYNGVTVDVNAPEGAFPAGTTLSIVPVVNSSIDQAVAGALEDTKQLNGTVAFNISFFDSNGNELQPAAGYQVDIKFGVSQNSTAVTDSTDAIQVFHMDTAAGAAEAVSSEVAVSGSGKTDIQVEAKSFSIYVVGTSEPKTLTFHFYDVNNQLIAADTQIVKSNEIVSEPAVPETAGLKFTGWFKTGSSTPYVFGSVGTISATATVDLYAKYSSEYHVYYENQNGEIIYTQNYADGEVLDYSGITLTVENDQALTGWYISDPSVPAVNGSPVTSDMILKPIISTGTWLTFDTNTAGGGSYIEPEFVGPSDVTAAPASPTRIGYDFAGWYTSSSNSTQFTFGNPLASSTTIYAKWTAKKVNYSVIIWKQKITDAKNAANANKTYDYGTTYVRSAEIGSAVSPTAQDKALSYTGFSYNAALTTVSATVAADGTTILNVYYDRNLITVNFYIKTTPNSDWSIFKTFTGLYGSTLASNEYTWPTGYDWYYGTIHLTFLDAFIPPKAGTTLNLYGQSTSSGSVVEHYKQNLDGTYPSTPTNSTATAGGTFNFTNKYNGFTLSQYSLDSGVTWYNASVNGSTGYSKTLMIRYTRNSYTLTFHNVNADVQSASVLYEGSLASYSSYIPSLPAGYESYYTFAGWYIDEACTQSFNFASTVMPANNLILYAKWVAPTFTVTFYNGQSVYQTVSNIAPKSTISAITPPTDSIKDFAGWVKEDGTPFSFSQKIEANLNIYATWMGGTTYTITYAAGTGSGTVPVDAAGYSEDAQAKVLSGAGLSAPTGKVFVGWLSSEDDKIYYPGSMITMGTEAITLTAQWANAAATTSLIYDYNGGLDADNASSSTVYVSLENSQVTVIGITGITRSDYVFTGWNTKADGTGTAVSAGQHIQIDNAAQYTVDQNILYAQWQQITHLIITGSDVSLTYNGSEQTNSVIAVSGLPSGYTYAGITVVPAKGTDASTTKYTGSINYSGIIIYNSNMVDVTKFFKVDSAAAPTLTITKRTVTLKSADLSKAYDGTALVNGQTSLAEEIGWVTGQGAVYHFTGSQLFAGESSNSFTYTLNTNTKDINYNILQTAGKLTVTQASIAITITAGSRSKPYDGTALTTSDYTRTGALASNDVLESVVIAGSQTNAGSSSNTASGAVIRHGTEDVTANYAITYTAGTLTVTPAAVELTANSGTKAYDGTALLPSGYTITSGAFVTGQGLSAVEISGSQLFVGSSSSHITGHTLAEGTDAANYTITYKDGQLTVTQAQIALTITADSSSKIYDGTALTDSGYTSTGTLAAHDILSSVAVAGTQTDAGSSANTPSGAVIMHDSVNVTANYAITYTAGTLTVTPAAVELTAASAEKVYDGLELTANHYSISSGSFVSGEGLADVNVSGSQLYKGSSSNIITGHTLATGTKAQNYTISYQPGTLTVNQASIQITITAGSGNKIYDGTALTSSDYTRTGSLAHGDEIASVSFAGSQINVGISDNVASAAEIKHGTVIVTENYVITYAKGSLEVARASLTVTTPDASMVYNGTPLTKDGTISGFVNQETATFTTTGSQRAVGSSPNTYSLNWNGSADPANYTIKESIGTLTVTENTEQIVVTTTGGSFTYDGKPHGATVSVSTLPTGYSLETAASNASATNVTAAAVTATCDTLVIRNAEGDDVTSKLNIQKIDGTIAITPAPLNVVTTSASKIFNNLALTAPGTITGMVEGETYTFTVTGSQTAVGSSANTYTLEWNGTALKSNYTVTESIGTLAVTASNENAVLTSSYSGLYDGLAHTITASAAVEGSTLYYTTQLPLTGNPGDGTDTRIWSTDLPTWINATAVQTVYVKAVAPNYSDAYGQATVTINQRAVTLTSGTSTKVYDGTALTNSTVTIGGDGFITGEGAAYIITGTQTEAGSSANAFTYVLNENTNAVNYTMTAVPGTLTVTARPDTPITPDRPETPSTPERPSTPNTSDQSNVPLAAGILAFSILLAGLALIFRKKYFE